MKNIHLITAILLTLLSTTLCNSTKAKEWKGLKPLRSTRVEVERELGKSSEENSIRAKYHLPGEDVYIVYSSNDEIPPDCVKKLPPGTVLLIQLTPKKKMRISETGLDESKMENLDPSSPPQLGYRCFIDSRAGVIVRTLNGYVDEIYYTADDSDRHLCEDFYARPEKFCQIIVDPRR